MCRLVSVTITGKMTSFTCARNTYCPPLLVTAPNSLPADGCCPGCCCPGCCFVEGAFPDVAGWDVLAALGGDVAGLAQTGKAGSEGSISLGIGVAWIRC